MDKQAEFSYYNSYYNGIVVVNYRGVAPISLSTFLAQKKITVAVDYVPAKKRAHIQTTATFCDAYRT